MFFWYIQRRDNYIKFNQDVRILFNKFLIKNGNRRFSGQPNYTIILRKGIKYQQKAIKIKRIN